MASALSPFPSSDDLFRAPARSETTRASDGVAGRPAAVVCVSVGPQDVPELRAFLLSLARSRAACGVPVAHGALAVLILAEPGTSALAAVEGLPSDYPFALRVGPPSDALGATRLAAAWAANLGEPDLPVLLARGTAPVAPRWAYETLSALRDGADVVLAPAGFLKRLVFGPGEPVALSSAAQQVLVDRAGQRAAGLAAFLSPWRRPRHTGLLSASH